jgi:hypothetical protein
MPIVIETLYVNINFNIPGSIDRYLTRNLFYFPRQEKTVGGGPLSRYPYFTFDVKYPIDELKQFGREKLVSFFFDKQLYANVLSGREIAKEAIDKYENGNYNVMCMLGCLFPTSFPVPTNIQNSFDIKIEKKINTSSDFDFSNEGSEFSYIQLGPSIYTVTKSLWINDIINNTTFQKLLNELNKYNDWEAKKKGELAKQIEIQKKKMIGLKNTFIKYYNSTEETLKELKKYSKLNENGRSRNSDILETVKANRAIPELEAEFNSFFENKENVDKIISAAIKIKTTIEKMGSYSQLIPREFLTIVKYASQIQIDTLTLDVIEHPEHIKKVGKKMREILGKYKNVGQIVNVLKEFSTPRLNTSNPKLQKLIDDFIRTKDAVSNNVKGFALYVRNVYVLKSKLFTSPYPIDLLNVGVALTKLPFVKNGKLIKTQERQLNIKIQLDAFKGIITKENVKCIHRNAVLEKLYESLTLNGDSKETVELDKIRPYLDFGAIKPANKQGGKSRKRSLNKRNITMKLRSKY